MPAQNRTPTLGLIVWHTNRGPYAWHGHKLVWA